MKTYEVVFNGDTDTGVYGISVVENPAMEATFLALSKQKKIEFAEVDRKEKTLLGVVLTPDKPIYRKNEDTGEEFYITFPRETIKAAAHSFLKNGYQKNSALEHDVALEGMSVVEAWVVKDSKNDTANAYGLKVDEGEWVVKMKCDNEDIYNKALKGEITGFSIDGLFNLKEINLKNNKMDLKELGTQIENSFTAALGKVFPKKELGDEAVALALTAISEAKDSEALIALKETYKDDFYTKVSKEFEAKELELKEAPKDDAEMLALVTQLTDDFSKKLEAIKLDANKENEILKSDIVKLKATKKELETKLAKKIVHAPGQAAELTATTQKGRIAQGLNNLLN
jgi:hypothetical protein